MASASTDIFRANSNSSFYSSLQSRHPAGSNCPALYRSEVVQCPTARTRVEVQSANNPGFDRVVQIPLANFGMLNKLALKIKFNKGNSGTGTASKGGSLTENVGAFCWKSCKLIVEGHTLATIFPEYVVAKFYKESHDEKRKCFRKLIGGWKNDKKNNFAINAAKAKDSPYPSAKYEFDQTYYCPLPFWFDTDESISRALDLSVLPQIFLEVHMQSSDDCHGANTNDLTTNMTINTIEAVQHLMELEADELKSFRAVTYSPAKSLSMIGTDIVMHQSGGHAHEQTTTSNKISLNLNMFSGQVSRLWVYVENDADHSADIKTLVRNKFNPVALSSIKLTATGSIIYELSSLSDNQKEYEDWINGTYSCCGSGSGSKIAAGSSTGGNWDSDSYPTEQFLPLTGTNYDSGGTGTTDIGGAIRVAVQDAIDGVNHPENKSFSSVNPANIYCINFKQIGSDQRRTSATGSLAFQQLSVPNLEVEVQGVAGSDPGGNVLTGDSGVKTRLTVIAENIVLYNTSTSNSGRTTMRKITT